ncbi:MAG: transporter substrate-binding domain-containing protein, partial [Bacteroidales bacterium]|nr:transporter substrate-binding domain-containing protein [Bacteroidales bacterium]
IIESEIILLRKFNFKSIFIILLKIKLCVFKKFILLFLILFFIGACSNKKEKKVEEINSIEKIRKLDTLKVVSDYNSTNYFIYRGETMGFQFELMQILAKNIGVKLEINVCNDIEKSFEYLISKKCDIIAFSLTKTKDRDTLIDFTIPHSTTRQVLIQKKPFAWKNMKASEINDSLIRSQLDLAGKKIYVQKNSSYATRLRNLSDEIGDSISIIESSNLEVEELWELVAKGEIKYTIADENVALVNKTYYPQLDVQTAISFQQNLAWGVRENDDSLRLEINKWLKKFKKSRQYRIIYNKYFKNRRSASIQKSKYYTITSDKISQYDDYIKKYSSIAKIDWRLLASLIYQESRFKSNVKSWAGAFGLMQLMPSTAARFGANKNSSPMQNIKSGVLFIKWLDIRITNLGIDDKTEKIKFILASYNAGLGHVLDARRLAEKFGKNPNVWDNNVDDFIIKKSMPKFYKDTVVKYGYCRGQETYTYVHQIIDRYEHYKNIIDE